jgi:hypothetical protein
MAGVLIGSIGSMFVRLDMETEPLAIQGSFYGKQNEALHH